MLQIRISEREESPVVKLIGQASFHDRKNILRVFEKLVVDHNETILVDLSELVYLDSGSVSTLILCAGLAAENGCRVELTGSNPAVARIFTVCGAVSFFKPQKDDNSPKQTVASNGNGNNKWHMCDFAIPGSANAIAVARNRIIDVLNAVELSEQIQHDITIAAGEALVNAIRHGCKMDSRMRVQVKCVAQAEKIFVEITDRGDGFDISDIKPVTARSLSEGGMGIYIMRELMDEVIFEFSSGTRVSLTRYLNN